MLPLPSFRHRSISRTEYKKSAEQLGNVDVLDPTPWRADILRDWCWDFLMTITLDFPLVSHIAFLRPDTLADGLSGHIYVDASGLLVSVVCRFDGVSAESPRIYFVGRRAIQRGYHAVLAGHLFAGQAVLRCHRLPKHHASGHRTLSLSDRQVP